MSETVHHEDGRVELQSLDEIKGRREFLKRGAVQLTEMKNFEFQMKNGKLERP